MYLREKKIIACLLSIDLSQHLLLVWLNCSNKSHRTLQFIFGVAALLSKKRRNFPTFCKMIHQEVVKPTFSDLKGLSSYLSSISKQSYALRGQAARAWLGSSVARALYQRIIQMYQWVCVRHTIPSQAWRSETIKPTDIRFQHRYRYQIMFGATYTRR